MSSLKEWEELLEKYKKLKKWCKGYDNGAEQFSQIVSEFVELDPEHGRQICRGFDVSLITLNRWIVNRNHPHELLRPLVFEFILRRVNRKIRVLSNRDAIIKQLKQHHKNNKGG